MFRSRRVLLSVFIVLALVLTAFGPTLASNSGGVLTPPAWARTLEMTPVFSTVAECQGGRPVEQTFQVTIKAKVAELAVTNRGLSELQLAVNGQALNLTPFLNGVEQTGAFDLSGFIHYGSNALSVRALGKPGTAADLTVLVPVFRATIAHLNDLHGAIDPLPKLATKISGLRQQGGADRVFFVNAGDNFSGNPYVDLQQGQPIVDLMNLMGLDLLTIGNHEFDYGQQTLASLEAASSFPWLAANVAVTRPDVPIANPVRYVIRENDLGQRIAFFGVTETPPSTAPKNTVGLEFSDPLATAAQQASALRSQANFVVAVTHIGLYGDTQLAQRSGDIDAIIGGHSHSVLTVPKLINGVLVTQAGSNGYRLGVVDLLEQGTQKSVQGYYVDARSLPADPAVQARVDEWKAKLAPFLNEVVGTAVQPLTAGSAKYQRDVSVGNLVADAMRDAMHTDIAFTNNGGLRADIPAGPITRGGIYSVLPFSNRFMSFRLTGAQLKETIGIGYTRPRNGRPQNQIDLQVSGLSYKVITDADRNYLDAELTIDGQPVDPLASYTVAVNDYMGYGGGNYKFLSYSDPLAFSADYDAAEVVAFIQRLGVVNYAPTEGRIAIVNGP